MVKCIFYEGLNCFAASTTDQTLISQLQTQIGQTKWVTGVIGSGTGDNTCSSTSRPWHYETFVGFSSVTIEECQTTLSWLEQNLSYWIGKTTCIQARLYSIDGDGGPVACNQPLVTLGIYK